MEELKDNIFLSNGTTKCVDSRLGLWCGSCCCVSKDMSSRLHKEKAQVMIMKCKNMELEEKIRG